MFCKECGTEIDNNAKYCPNCGTKISTQKVCTSMDECSEREAANIEAKVPAKSKKGIKVVNIIAVVFGILIIGTLYTLFTNGTLSELFEHSGDINATQCSRIAQVVKTSMQDKFQTDPSLSPRNLIVDSVKVLNSNGNNYKGIATITRNGISHEVPIDIVNDGSNVMWQSQPGALLF